MNTIAARRARVTRTEAAKILSTTYENVRRMQRVGQLHSTPDKHGVHRFDRREVEDLARRRGLQIKPSGELTARVFKLFAAKRSFHEVCIEAEQEPDVIQGLWERYQGGFDYGKKQRDETDDARKQREHDDEMRAMDRELERRRRATLATEDMASPVRAQSGSALTGESGSSES